MTVEQIPLTGGRAGGQTATRTPDMSASSGLDATFRATAELCRSSCLAALDWFCPFENHVARTRGRIVVLVSGGMMVWGPVFALLYLHRFGWTPGFVIASLATIWIASVPLLLRHTRSIWLGGNCLVLNLLLGVTYLSYLGGGQGSPPLNWIVALPILAISLSGRNSGLFWAAVGLIDLAIFHIIDGAGLDLPQHLSHSQRSLLQLTVLSGLLAMLLSIALMNESHRVQTSRALVQRQADLREAAARLQAIVDYAPDAIVTFNTRGIIESFNPAAQRLFHYKAADIIGQPLRKLLPTPTLSSGDPGSTQVAASLGLSGNSGQRIVARRRDGGLIELHVTVGQAKIGNRPVLTAMMREMPGVHSAIKTRA